MAARMDSSLPDSVITEGFLGAINTVPGGNFWVRQLASYREPVDHRYEGRGGDDGEFCRMDSGNQ